MIKNSLCGTGVTTQGIPVSVVMPAYNCERTIAEAVRSVQNQAYKNWKLFIIDDCSADRTIVIAQELAGSDSRITVLLNPTNQGVGRTRNRGVSEAKTEWIAFLDSDDLWKPVKLEKQINLISENPEANIVFTGSGFIDTSGNRLDYILHVPERISRKELLKQNLISCSSVLVRKDLLLKHPMPEKGFLHEDFATWLSILDEEPYAYGIDEPLLIYRLSGHSKSGNKMKAARMNWNTYQYCNLKSMETIYYMGCYFIRNMKKYSKLKSGKRFR